MREYNLKWQYGGIIMANWTNEAVAREQIKTLVAEYYHEFKEPMESK